MTSPLQHPPAARFAGVLGWGFGLKEVAGRLTATLAWRAYVARKLPRDALDPGDRIPATIGGVATDVIEHVPTHSARGTIDAAVPGTRIVNARGVPGTLGCHAWARDSAERMLLSNWHILFGEGANGGEGVYIVEGEGPRYALIGRTRRGLLGPIALDGQTYHVDAAIAACEHDTPRRRGPPLARAAAWTRAGDLVRMRGAVSGKTAGIVVDTAYPDVAMIEGLPIAAERQILVRPAPGDAPFAQIGDSGAVLTDPRARAVGLLWGSNDRGEGIACHMLPALHALDVTLSVSWPDRWRRLLRRMRGLINRSGRS